MIKISRFVERYENMPLGPALWLATALFIIFVRDGIECLVSTGSFAVPDGFHLLHVPVFFLSLLIFVIVILSFVTSTAIQKVSRLALTLFPIILLPVVLDLLTTLVTKNHIPYHYILNNPGLGLLRFFDPTYKIPEVSGSLRFEVALIVSLAFGYVLLKTKRVSKAALGACLILLVSYFYGFLPALLIEFYKFLALIINTLHLKNFPYTQGNIDESLLSILDLMAASLIALVWLWRYNGAKCKAVLGNMRLTRTCHYMLLCLVGVLTCCAAAPVSDIFALIRIAGALLSVGFAFQFSVVTNDIFDVDCDRISNASRPLAKGVLEKREYLIIAFVYLSFSLLLAYWVSETSLMAIVLFIACYFLYSAPPLRLKRFFPLSAFIIGLEALLSFIAGVFALERTGLSGHLSAPLLWLILTVFFLSSNIKDLKDREGDRATGIPTLPVWLGEKWGRNLIALLVFLSYCLVPIVLPLAFPGLHVLVVSVVFGLGSLIYIVKKNAKEEVIFLIYFLYILFLISAVRALG